MAKKMLIDATHAEETRVVVVDGNKVEEFDFETVNKRQLAGNIYLAKVTRVEPSLQAAFVDYGGNRHGFLAFSEIHPDYYQIPVADRQALLEEERAYAEEADAEDSRRRRSHRGGKARAEAVQSDDNVVSSDHIPGMGVVDLTEEDAESVETDAPTDAPQDASVEEPAETSDNSFEQPETGDDTGDAPYVAADHASDTDDEIESVADEDVTEEIRQPRKARPRKYKIQEVVKVRQILLVQVVKEERGNKGAALTTYLSLAGRYCVLMPNTARGGGISRKITNAADRKKLKEIASEIEVPVGAGLIIRTAGSQRTKAEIKRDYEYLMRLWEQIRDLTMKSIAPAPIYEEGDLIKRSIRDLYNKDIDEVLVEGGEGYRAAKDFMKMIMPSHGKNVKNYNEGLPLFARYQVESYLAAMFNPTVQLRSGGYIVIGVTEALVAIDVNSGRATKEGSIEDTALKTNLEAAEEVARQLRLRDLAGLIVIDFIDMEERKNNAAVEKRLKDKLKTDRARIQVGRISGFGLMEMSRQRLRPGMLESTTQPCAHCHGTGIIRSDDSLALQILRQLEEEGTRKRSREVLLKAPVAVINFLVNYKREHIAQIELRYGMAVRLEADPALISPDFDIEKFKTATRNVPEAVSQVVSVDALRMEDDVEDEEIDETDDAEEAEEAGETGETPQAASDGDAPRKKKRRRRRRRKSGSGAGGGQADASDAADGETEGESEGESDAVEATAPDAPVSEAATEDAPKSRARGSRSRKKTDAAAPSAEVATSADTTEAEATDEARAAPKPRSRSRSKAKTAEAPAEDVAVEEVPAKPKPTRSRSRKKVEPAPAVAASSATDATPDEETAPQPAAAAETTAPEPVASVPAPIPMPEPSPHVANDAPQADPEQDAGEADDKPKRRGWWSLGR